MRVRGAAEAEPAGRGDAAGAGRWTGARSPSLKLLLGLAARPGALRKARSRLLCCLASCSMVSSRWTRCSCSYCSARCHFRLCVSASSRKSLQAWGRGGGREQRGGPRGSHPQRAQKHPRCPLSLSWGQETPAFSEPAWRPPWLAAHPRDALPEQQARCCQPQPAHCVFLRAGAPASLCAGPRFVTSPSPLEAARSWQPGPDPDLGAEGRKTPRAKGSCPANET